MRGFDAGLIESYKTIAMGLAAGLRLLGVEVRVVPPELGSPRGGARNPSCFAAASGYELKATGGKLVGSAQKRGRRALLQHGSILHESHRHTLAPLLRAGAGQPPETASLRTSLGRSPGSREVAEALRLGFERAWGIIFTEAPLAEEEKDLAGRLREERYRPLQG